jgi:hypothetical protein
MLRQNTSRSASSPESLRNLYNHMSISGTILDIKGTTCYRLELLSRRTNKRFHICLQHYKSSAYPKTLPRAGHYDTEAGVTGQDVSYRPWAENNPVTSLASSNFQSALASTHKLSLIKYILSHCISKSLHPSSPFLLPGGFRSSTCLGYGLPTVLWSPLYIYCL